VPKRENATILTSSRFHATWMSITPLLLLRRALWLEHLGIRDAAISANRNMTAKRTVAPSVLSSTVFHGLKVFPDAGITASQSKKATRAQVASGMCQTTISLRCAGVASEKVLAAGNTHGGVE